MKSVKNPARSGTAPMAQSALPLDPLPLRLAFILYKRILSPIAHAISPTQCLFLPTCSEYTYVALHRFGLVKGSWLALKRLARCHPFAKGGLDIVPEPPVPEA